MSTDGPPTPKALSIRLNMDSSSWGSGQNRLKIETTGSKTPLTTRNPATKARHPPRAAPRTRLSVIRQRPETHRAKPPVTRRAAPPARPSVIRQRPETHRAKPSVTRRVAPPARPSVVRQRPETHRAKPPVTP
ncbi:hypothetical protein GCM10022380_27850 [Amycolatopsis tucumanensis]|uniref:Uncharacterized protein n=1 Tax=Amycolatopsis tucumanensis TaxID=401106 RepID=A0ABP7I317_9PSEU